MEDILLDPDLKPFIVPNAKFTGIKIGAGAYGSVEEVLIPGAICAAKHIHNFFQDTDQIFDGKALKQFARECQLMSTLRHPHIVQFLGVCVFPGSRLPALLMEQLLTNLHDVLDPEISPPPPLDAPKPYFPLRLKCSILLSVASGLEFLHEQSPPIIHRDLSARNVLLNEGMIAKIADLGMARMVPHLRNAATMTKAPGASIYMPPEAVEVRTDDREHEKKIKYDSSIDVFSFGVVSIFTLSQTFPCNLLTHNYRDEQRHIVGRSELERREQYMKIIYSQLRENHPLIQMIQKCLDFPEDRPGIRDVLQLLKQAKSEEKDENVDMNKLMLLRALHDHTKKMKHTVEEIELQQQLQCIKKEKERISEQLDKANNTISQNQRWMLETKHYTDCKVANLEDVNLRLQHIVQQLQREKAGLENDIATVTVTANVYKKDFEEERSDRTRLAGRLETLKQQSIKDAEKIQSLEVNFKQEIEAKSTEIKNYQQLVERLQKGLSEAKQQNQRMEPLVSLQHEEKIRAEYPVKLHEEKVQPTQQPTESKTHLPVPDDHNQQHYVNSSSLRRSKSMASLAECTDQSAVHNRPWSPNLYQINEDCDDTTNVDHPGYHHPSHFPPVRYRQQQDEVLDFRSSNKAARNFNYMRDKRYSVQIESDHESSSKCIYCNRQFSDLFKYLRHEKSCPQRPGI